MTWKLPGSHTATPRETTGNPKGECRGCVKSYRLSAGYTADCNTLQQAVQPGPLPPRMVPWWNKGLSCLQASTRQLFNQAKRQVTGNHMRRPSPVITNRSERSNSLLGRTTVRGWRLYLTQPNSWGSWPVSHPTGWNLLQYLMADMDNLQTRPWGN